eukprot:CAMPEP_0196585092 /NCGR_PEP_ID=MMETSP1081-20130531/49505_1 /TAXON_ID=36882 /ORGANISM="Pyramimonas amylifera, Strain CCMP720" /LENGTH=127 /DNA_ID=CAMNT_0041906523 /DNA_START=72 /DNA_END=455 /DNA_ORIENTATION=+
MASPDLIWLCVKKNNAFLVKRTGVQFSNEKYNVKSLNTFKHSGLANVDKFDITPADEADNLSINFFKVGSEPVLMKGYDVRQMIRKVGAGLEAYRTDLKGDALVKLTHLHKSLRVAKAGIKKSKSKK